MVKETQRSKYIKDCAKRLCKNRSLYNFNENIEKKIVGTIERRNELPQLIHEIISLLHGADGDIRIGAAEILGTITPISMAKAVKKELEKHLDDNFVRDYVYDGFQGDQEDLRTVSKRSKLSIDMLGS